MSSSWDKRCTVICFVINELGRLQAKQRFTHHINYLYFHIMNHGIESWRAQAFRKAEAHEVKKKK